MALGGLVLALPATATAQQPASTQPSAADLESARVAFKDAMIQREGGDVAGSLEKFKAAHALGHTPVTGLELGRTQMMLGKLVEARETLLSVARIPVAPDEGEKSAESRKEAAELADSIAQKIPSLIVHVKTPRPDDVPTVAVDGAPVPAAALVAPRKLNPGSHEVTARVGDGPETHETVVLKESESREVTLDVQAGVPGPAPVNTQTPKEQPKGPTRLNPLVYVGFGVGGAALVAGSITGAVAISKGNKISSACTGTKCPSSVKSDVTTGRTMATISTISFVVAGVGAAVGVYGLLSPIHVETKTASARLVVLPSGAFVAGSF